MKKLMLIVVLLFSSFTFASNFASPKEPSAKLILNHSHLSKQISPVRLLTVNGENVGIRSETAWLKPGEYQLRFGALVDRKYTKNTISPRQRRSLDNEKMIVNLTVEADKSYYVGFDTSSRNTHEWKPIVYKVK